MATPEDAAHRWWRKDVVPPDRLFIWLPETPLLKMPHSDGSETSSRREFSHWPRSSSADDRILHYYFILKYREKYLLNDMKWVWINNFWRQNFREERCCLNTFRKLLQSMSWKNYNNLKWGLKKKNYTASLAEWSACLITNQEVAGSIPSTSTILKSGLGLEQGPPSLVRTIGWLHAWEVANLIKEADIIDLMESSAICQSFAGA